MRRYSIIAVKNVVNHGLRDNRGQQELVSLAAQEADPADEETGDDGDGPSRDRNSDVALATGSDELLDQLLMATFKAPATMKIPSEPLMIPRMAAAVAVTGRLGPPIGGTTPYGGGTCP